jgi:hypothetical protein
MIGRWAEVGGVDCVALERVTRTNDGGLLTGEAWTNGNQRLTVQMLSSPGSPREAAASALIEYDAKVARCAATTSMRAPDA